MNSVIEVLAKSHAHIFLETDDSGILQEVHEHFTFFTPGYKFMPAYKNKLWDGKIRLFNLRSRLLPRGLLYALSEFCKSRDYRLNIASSILEPRSDIEPPKDILDQLVLSGADGNAIELRDYQTEAYRFAIANRRGVLVSPTGSGKSLIIYALIRWFIDNFPEAEKVIVIVPTTSLVEQMYKDFGDYSRLEPHKFNHEVAVHRIYSGKEKVNISARIIVTTWQSAITMPAAWFKDFGLVIGDEAHLFKAQSLTKIMDNLVNAEYRIGTTGTLDGTQVHRLILEGCFGPVYQVTTTKKLIEADTLAQLKIQVLVLKYNDATRKEVTSLKLKYPDEIAWITNNEPRNRLITNLAIDQQGNTLVLYNLVEKHGIPLYDRLKKKLLSTDPGRQLFFVSGSVKTDERERIREIIEKETNAIIVASLGTFSVGINIKNLHNIIFASPSKSQIRVLQSIGRGLRKASNNQGTMVYDIADDLSWKKRRNFTLDHGIERIAIYNKEGFDYTTHLVDIL